MNKVDIEQIVDQCREHAARIAKESAMLAHYADGESLASFEIGALIGMIRALLADTDEPTRQRVAARFAAWRDYVETERAA